MKYALSLFFFLAPILLWSQGREGDRVFGGRVTSLLQVGSGGSGGTAYWQLTGNFSDPAGLYDAGDIQESDVIYFVNGGIGIFLPIDTILSQGTSSFNVRCLKGSITSISSVPSTNNAAICRLTVNRLLYPFIGNLTAAGQQVLSEDTYFKVDTISGATVMSGQVDSIAALTDTSFVYFNGSGTAIDTVVIPGGGGVSGAGGADTIYLADGTSLVNGDTLPAFVQTVTDGTTIDFTKVGDNLTGEVKDNSIPYSKINSAFRDSIGRVESVVSLGDTIIQVNYVDGGQVEIGILGGGGTGVPDTFYLADGTMVVHDDTIPYVTGTQAGIQKALNSLSSIAPNPTDSIYYFDIGTNAWVRSTVQALIDIMQDSIPAVTASRGIKRSANDFRLGSSYIETAIALQENRKLPLGGFTFTFGDPTDSTLLIVDGANDVLKIGKNFTGTPPHKLNISGGTRWHKASATSATSTSGALDLSFIGGSSDNPQLVWYDPAGAATMGLMGGAGTNYITGNGRLAIGATTTTDATPSSVTYGIRFAHSSGIWIDAPYTAIDFEIRDINRSAGTAGQVFSSGGSGGSVNWQNDVQHVEATEAGTTSTFNPSKDGGTDRGFVLINNADHVASLPSGSSDTQLEAGDEVTYVLIVAPTSSTSVYVSGAAASVTINGAVNDQGTWSTQYQSKTYHWTGSAWYIK